MYREELYGTKQDGGHEMWKYKLKTNSLFYYENKKGVSNVYWTELLYRMLTSEVQNIKRRERESTRDRPTWMGFG